METNYLRLQVISSGEGNHTLFCRQVYLEYAVACSKFSLQLTLHTWRKSTTPAVQLAGRISPFETSGKAAHF